MEMQDDFDDDEPCSVFLYAKYMFFCSLTKLCCTLECLSIAVETVQMLGGGGGTLNCLLGHPILNRVG